MTQKNRKEFKKWQVAIVYDLQEGVCSKCGKPLGKKFHRHHKDGDNSNNDINNLELQCPICHGGEAYAIYIKQKMGVIGTVGTLVRALVNKEISGSAGEVALGAIKLELSLIEQCYPTKLEGVPVEIRVRNYLVGSGILLKEYEKGVREGMIIGANSKLDMLKELMDKYGKCELDKAKTA